MKPFLGVLTANAPTTCRYIDEILAHAGLFAKPIERGDLVPTLSEWGLVLLVGNLSFDEEEQEALTQFVTRGGALLAVGSTSGLDSLLGVEQIAVAFETGFGVEKRRRLGEGSVQILREHPITRGLGSSLHTFGGAAVRATEGTSLARMRDALYRPTEYDAIVEHHVGRGLTLLIAPDLCGSVVRIQQGIYVDQDGVPAADGSAPLDDGILKCEDGMVLRFEGDRTQVDDGSWIFYHPIADELRELVIRAILYAAHRQRLALPMLWYYPRNLPALGHLSHDSDGNHPGLAWRLLDVLREVGIHTTWCILEPGYAAEFYAALKEGGYEIALHYDALDGRPRTSWGEWPLRGQIDWLTRAAGVPIRSNKNHYTRWEGRLDFFRWCARLGIECDQSKGPSKHGTLGYPFGGCHPWFPLDDDGSFIDCLELNLQTQDLVVTSPDYFGRYWVDQAVRHHGVAHLLFHPAHIEKPGVADALRWVVGYGRDHGLEWWTCDQINRWERARRQVRWLYWQRDPEGMVYRFYAAQPLAGATLLVLDDAESEDHVERYGFSFRKVELDLEGEQEIHVDLPDREMNG